MTEWLCSGQCNCISYRLFPISKFKMLNIHELINPVRIVSFA